MILPRLVVNVYLISKVKEMPISKTQQGKDPVCCLGSKTVYFSTVNTRKKEKIV
jgi:hypothetical protein